MTAGDLELVLSRHRGKHNAITVRDIAIRLGVDERTVRRLKRELAETVLIGSSCERNHAGYYIPETQSEIDDTLANYYSRIRAIAELIKATKGAPEVARLMRQLEMELL